jgi:hypothetical protein
MLDRWDAEMIRRARAHDSAHVVRAIVVAIRAIYQATFQKTCIDLHFARDRQFRAPLEAKKSHLF